MKRAVLFLLGIIYSVILFSQSAGKIGDLGLDNLYMIARGVYRSEQPGREQFKALEKYGIREVLNLRAWHSDSRLAKGAGLILHRVRMSAHNANDYDVVAALRIIKNRKGAILIHCHHGSDRTGLIAAMYKIVFLNTDKKDAIAEMTDGGFGFHGIYDNIRRYIIGADIDSIRKQLETE
ncbi:MAG: tyrosine-protein phosphatase [Prevotellaceae bacterium]|jgi:protein tyrosine/serine phosphatase|nr:tyrosine-protein phosphatase [Prevotellaceae bacterium]